MIATFPTSSSVPTAPVSQPRTSATDGNISSYLMKKVVVVFGVILGVVTLSVSLVALVIVRRKRRPPVTPLSHGNLEHGGTHPACGPRALQLVANIRRHVAAISFCTLFGWNRIDESGAGYISPFEPPERTVVFEGKNRRPLKDVPVRPDAAGEVTVAAPLSTGSARSASVQVSGLTSSLDKDITEYLDA